jgi:hypothetical protein
MVAPIQGLPLPVELDLVLPAEALAVGANLAHDTRCPALGKRPISTPISAMSSCAPILPTPGISSGTVASGDHSNRRPPPESLNAIGEAKIDCFEHF